LRYLIDGKHPALLVQGWLGGAECDMYIFWETAFAGVWLSGAGERRTGEKESTNSSSFQPATEKATSAAPLETPIIIPA
jgi:hypothetical protein